MARPRSKWLGYCVNVFFSSGLPGLSPEWRSNFQHPTLHLLPLRKIYVLVYRYNYHRDQTGSVPQRLSQDQCYWSPNFWQLWIVDWGKINNKSSPITACRAKVKFCLDVSRIICNFQNSPNHANDAIVAVTLHNVAWVQRAARCEFCVTWLLQFCKFLVNPTSISNLTVSLQSK